MGTTHTLAAAAAKTTSGSSSSLLLIILVFAGLMIFMFRSQRKRQRATQNTQRQVMNGTRIRTVHGIYGTVVDGDDRNVIVEVAPGVRIKMLRQAIGVVVPDDEPDGLNPTMPGTDQADSGTSDSSSAKTEDRSDLTL
ncbi:MAG TPA: preprotein translocase subunit YajC [Streptosporangiaceae bacterium]|nr:preprotein translocase subunit YajC [Streptosporangiaceae bacterium]